MVRNPWKLPFDYFFVQALHVISSERWHQRTHLVEYAAQGPDITLTVVRLVTPDLRTGIVGRSRLCVAEAFFYYFADVEVS